MYHVYSIAGFGCWIVDKETKETLGNVVYFNKCNASIMGMMKNIIQTCWKHSSSDLKYAYKIVRQVKKSIEDKEVEKVYMIGHSFGGFVCAIVAQSLCGHPQAHKLDIVTYGAIIIIDPATCPGVQFRQYMYRDDISLKCIENRQHITFLKNPIQINNILDSIRTHLSYPVYSDRAYLVKKYEGLKK